MKRRLTSPTWNGARRIRLLLVVGFVWGCTALLAPTSCEQTVLAQQERVNIWDTKRNTGPSAPRPKADEDVVRTLRDAMGRDFGPGSMSTNLYFVVFFLFLAVVVGALVYYDIHYRRRFQSAYEDPDLLFKELCAAHELTWSERRFLRNLADQLDFDDPLPLFIEPNHFLDALKNEEFSESEPTLRYFLEKLFDQETEAPRDTDPPFPSVSRVGRRADVDASTVYTAVR